MKKTLSEYIKIGSETEIPDFPIANHELRSLLDKLETSSEPTLTHKLNNHKGKIIMGIIGLVFISTLISLGISYFSPITEEQTNLVNQTKDNQSQNVIIEHQDKQQNNIQNANKVQSNLNQEKKNENRNQTQTYNMISFVDENLILKRPFSKEKRDYSKTFHIGTSGEEKNLLEPASLIKDQKGASIPGLFELELTNDQLKNIGIIIDDKKIVYITEEWERIHPLRFNHDNGYKYSNRIYNHFKSGYPITGDTFILKTRNSIDLNFQFDPNKDTIQRLPYKQVFRDKRITDTIDGKPVTYSKLFVYDTSDKNVGNMSKDDYDKLRDKLNIAFNQELFLFDSTGKDSYSRTAPVCIAFNYSPIKHKYQTVINRSPLLAKFKNKSLWDLDYAQLLPLKINFNDKIINKIVFWFVPNEELISRLPNRYQSSIRKELEALKNIKEGNMNPEMACSAIKDTSFFDVCRISSGAISIEGLSPNPAQQESSLVFNLKEERQINISLYDMTGKFIGNFVESEKMARGKHEQPIKLENVPSGIYLIAIKSNIGELVTQKLIINN